MVALYQDAQSISGSIQLDLSGRRANASFKTITYGSPSGSHTSFLKICLGRTDGGEDVLLCDHAVGNLIQGRIVAFTDDWINRKERDMIPAAQIQHIFHQSVVNQADVQRIGQCDGRFQTPQLIHLDESLRFPKPIQYEGGGGKFMGKRVFRTGKNHSNTGLVRTFLYSTVADGDTGDVGDFIEGTGGKRTDGNAEIPDACLHLLHIIMSFLLQYQFFLQFNRIRKAALRL